MLTLRRARMSDAALVLAWRNEAATRASRQDRRLIQWEEHCSWFLGRIADDTLYIAELNAAPVGQITLDGKEEIGWIVGPAYRGAGIGKAMLGLALRRFPERYRAKMLVYNVASHRLAASCGFTTHFCTDTPPLMRYLERKRETAS